MAFELSKIKLNLLEPQLGLINNYFEAGQWRGGGYIRSMLNFNESSIIEVNSFSKIGLAAGLWGSEETFISQGFNRLSSTNFS